VSNPLMGSYSIFGLTLPKSLHFHGVGVVFFVVGAGRELVAMKRGTGGLLRHVLRILAFLLAGSFFFVAVKYLAQDSPPAWSAVLSAALIVVAAVILATTGPRRAAANRLGKHADHGQDSEA
jgi:hypothetical protein